MKIDTIITDIDGVLTDGGYYWSEKGLLFKKFNTRDASAAKRFVEAGYKLFIMTSCNDEVTKSRINGMLWTSVRYGVEDKLEAVKEIISSHGLRRESICYIGDDHMDVEAMEYCGFAVCPRDATRPAYLVSDQACLCKGGEGVLAETIDLIMSFEFKEKDNAYDDR